MLFVAVQPFPSVAVTVYVPAASPEMDVLVDPVDHKYDKPPVPPDADAEAVPSESPLQLMLLSTTDEATKTAGSVIVELELSVQPLASVTVTLYVPATIPVMLAVVALLLHE